MWIFFVVQVNNIFFLLIKKKINKQIEIKMSVEDLMKLSDQLRRQCGFDPNSAEEVAVAQEFREIAESLPSEMQDELVQQGKKNIPHLHIQRNDDGTMLISPTTCTVCSGVNVTKLRCARCHGPFYCSQECQRQDWPKHRQVCRKD